MARNDDKTAEEIAGGHEYLVASKEEFDELDELRKPNAYIVSVEDRDYVCRRCEGIVTGRWQGAGSFKIGCDCTSVPVVPQLGQADTPDVWRVERESCCEDVDVSKLRKYRGELGEYQCGSCEAVYEYGGRMVIGPNQDAEAKEKEYQEL